jgi:hypothetical protein
VDTYGNGGTLRCGQQFGICPLILQHDPTSFQGSWIMAYRHDDVKMSYPTIYRDNNS